jgi:predicted XRE-type DNA-binding protein
MSKGIEIHHGSGNVFADIGLKDADELFARAQIGLEVLKILQERDLKQREIAGLLGIKQSEVSYLMRGQFQRFSEGKLVSFLKKLKCDVMLVISQPDTRCGVSISL